MEERIKAVLEELGSVEYPTNGEIVAFYLIKELEEEINTVKIENRALQDDIIMLRYTYK